MPGQLRIQYPGTLYQFTARGDRREDIAHDDGDGAMLLATLAAACKKKVWEVLTWWQEWPGSKAPSGKATMRSSGCGHLFGGRDKAIVAQSHASGGAGSGARRRLHNGCRGRVRESGAQPAGRALRRSAESKACHDEEEAEPVVAEGMKCLHLTAAELKATGGSELRKVAIVQAVHQKTAAPRQCTAARLAMKRAVNVRQQIKRLKTEKLNLPREMKHWLSIITPFPTVK